MSVLLIAAGRPRQTAEKQQTMASRVHAETVASNTTVKLWAKIQLKPIATACWKQRLPAIR